MLVTNIVNAWVNICVDHLYKCFIAWFSGENANTFSDISATSASLPTWVIYKGANPTQSHIDSSLPPRWYFSYSDSGFSTKEIGLD